MCIYKYFLAGVYIHISMAQMYTDWCLSMCTHAYMLVCITIRLGGAEKVEISHVFYHYDL
jgi:hypothetical protein